MKRRLKKKKSFMKIKSIKKMNLKNDDILIIKINQDDTTLVEAQSIYDCFKEVVSNEIRIIWGGIDLSILKKDEN